MKILILATDFKPNSGGIAELAFQICGQLANKGHVVSVITHRVKNCRDEEAMSGFTVHRIFKDLVVPDKKSLVGKRIIIGHWVWQTRRKVLRFVAQQKPDLIFCTNYKILLSSIFKRCALPMFLFLPSVTIGNSAA